MMQPQFKFAFSRSASGVCASRTRRGAFTLVEIMVALAIFAVMMAIIFIPLNLGLNLFAIGQTRSTVLQAANVTLDDMERELQKAIMVFPNEALPGVTDRAPYTAGGFNPNGHPYIRVQAAGQGVCDTDTAVASYVDNPHRLEFLLPDTFDGTEEQTQPVMPLRAAPYLISYYYRRQTPTSVADPFDNPIMLYRAQMPYRENGPNGAILYNGGGRNVNLLPTPQGTDPSRYPNPTDATACGGSATATNRGSYWLNQLYAPTDPLSGTLNEPQLEPLTLDSNVVPKVNGSHTAMLPKGVALVTRKAFHAQENPPVGPSPDFTPDTTFRCADTNSDGKIDQVTITLVVGSFDEGGADRSNSRASDRTGDTQVDPNQGVNAQRIRLTRVVRLTNVK